MTLTNIGWLHAATWWITHPSRPCTDKRARELIQHARINAFTEMD